MKCPSNLDDEAKAFWKRHCKGCVDNGTLTEHTVDSFAMLCRVHSLIANTDPNEDSKKAMMFNGLLKNYFTLARPFGVLGNKVPAPKRAKNLQEVIAEAMKGDDAEES